MIRNAAHDAQAALLENSTMVTKAIVLAEREKELMHSPIEGFNRLTQ